MNAKFFVPLTVIIAVTLAQASPVAAQYSTPEGLTAETRVGRSTQPLRPVGPNMNDLRVTNPPMTEPTGGMVVRNGSPAQSPTPSGQLAAETTGAPGWLKVALPFVPVLLYGLYRGSQENQQTA